MGSPTGRMGEVSRGIDNGHNLMGFTDTDFARDVNDQRSMSGWIFTFNGALIFQALKKQGLVTCSLMEAELMVGSIASAEGIWLIRLGRDFRHDFTPSPCLLTINLSSCSWNTMSTTQGQSTLTCITTMHVNKSMPGTFDSTTFWHWKIQLIYWQSHYLHASTCISSALSGSIVLEGVCCESIFLSHIRSNNHIILIWSR